MFSDEEIKEYQNEFNKVDILLNQDEIRIMLDYMYSFGLMTYEYLNNENNFVLNDK